MAPRSAIAVIAALLVGSCGGDDTATTTSPDASSSTSSTSSGAGDGSWSWVADDTSVFGGSSRQEIQDVVLGPAGLVAVGSNGFADAVGGAVWTQSADGSWSRVPDASGVFDAIVLKSIVAGGPGLVAAGWAYSEDNNTDAALFSSTDGSSWERVADPIGEFGGTSTQAMLQVVVGGPGLVAVGSDRATGDSDAAIWVSADGSTWERVDDPGLTLPGQQAILGVIATATGLVAVGSDDSGGDLDAAVWTSADGLTWTPVVDQASLGGGGLQRMVAIAAAGPGLVAVGAADAADGLDAALWVSADGFTWERITDASFGGAGDQVFNAVAEWGSGIVAVGYEFFADSAEFAAVVWQSPDSSSWERVTDPVFAGSDSQLLQAVIIANGQVVVAGLSGTDEEADAAVWTRDQS